MKAWDQIMLYQKFCVTHNTSSYICIIITSRKNKVGKKVEEL